MLKFAKGPGFIPGFFYVISDSKAMRTPFLFRYRLSSFPIRKVSIISRSKSD